jgi:hypothetical protein
MNLLFSESRSTDESIVDERAHKFERESFIFDAFFSEESTIESKKSNSEELSTEKTKKTRIESQNSHSKCSSFETKNSTKEHATQMNSFLRFFSKSDFEKIFHFSSFLSKDDNDLNESKEQTNKQSKFSQSSESS